jgi:hypothetical protein
LEVQTRIGLAANPPPQSPRHRATRRAMLAVTQNAVSRALGARTSNRATEVANIEH